MSYLCCCYSSSERPPVTSPPDQSCVMGPLVETIIEWENSDSCTLKVLAFAIKYFGSLILIGSFVGIWPFMSARKEYHLQIRGLEGRVEVLASPVGADGQSAVQSPLMLSPASPHSGSRSSQVNSSAGIRASLERVRSPEKGENSATPEATPEYYIDLHNTATTLINQTKEKLAHTKSTVEFHRQQLEGLATDTTKSLLELLTRDLADPIDTNVDNSLSLEELDTKVSLLTDHLDVLETRVAAIRQQIHALQIKSFAASKNHDPIKQTLTSLLEYLKDESPVPKTPSPNVKRQLTYGETPDE